MMLSSPPAFRLAATPALVLALALGSCGRRDHPATAGGATSAAPIATTTTSIPTVATNAITVKDFAFGPKAVTVKAGTTITWTNADAFDHSVFDTKSNTEGAHFGPIAAHLTYSRTYNTVGAYPYFCGIHNSMTGTVIVTS
jgi:plastocyanin